MAVQIELCRVHLLGFSENSPGGDHLDDFLLPLSDSRLVSGSVVLSKGALMA